MKLTGKARRLEEFQGQKRWGVYLCIYFLFMCQNKYLKIQDYK